MARSLTALTPDQVTPETVLAARLRAIELQLDD
jgi:hypothetical protein